MSNMKLKIKKIKKNLKNPFREISRRANEAVTHNAEISDENISSTRDFFKDAVDREDAKMEGFE